MTKIQDVTGTAFIVAEYRARENGETNPLCRDPIVPLLLNERTRQAADRMAGDFRQARRPSGFVRATTTIISMRS
jgi:O-methyltransferase involved in polyketide biosynthesis